MQTSIRRILLLLWLIYSLDSKSQCASGKYTYTLSGNIATDIYVTNGDTVLIDSTANLIGNLYVINSRVVNCGNITNSKIKLKGNWLGFNGKLENFGNIKSDSILVDTIGDIHNYHIIDAMYTYIGVDGNIDNWVLHKTDYLEMNKSWYYFNIGHLFINRKLNVTDTRIRNEYMIRCKNQFLLDSSSRLFNGCTIYVDSLFHNKGYVTVTSLSSPKYSKIIIQEQSINSGSIYYMDICDLTSFNSGSFDLNTGTLNSITLCQVPISCPDYTTIRIEENDLENQRIYVFPNPANSQINIKGLDNHEEYTLNIKNILGEIVFTTYNTQNIEISSLSNGTYFIEVVKKGLIIKAIKFIKS